MLEPSVLCVVRAFHASRRYSEQMVGRCVARLVRSCAPDEFDGPGPTAPQRSSHQVYGALYGDTSVRLSLARVGRYLQQRRRLRQKGADLPVCVVALNSRRFAAAHLSSMREYLEGLAQPLPRISSGQRLADSIRTAEVVLICDPVMCSPLWTDAPCHWREQVFIVDGAFLLFTVLASPVSLWRSLLASMRRLFGAGPPGGQGVRDAIVGSVLIEAYGRILEHAAEIRSVLFTSNSFLTEMLRLWLLKRDACRAVVEVLHGTPTYDYVTYLRTILDGCDARGKHQFLPQVPLPAFPPPLDRLHPDTAVNGYVNHYFLARPAARADALAFVRREWEELVGGVARRPFVVAFVGATSHDTDFLRSDAFRVERYLIRRARAVLRESGVEYVIVYTPHPLHGLVTVASHPFFQSPDVRLHADTVFSWFVGDVCVGLYSSALFEARFCGLATFTPLVPLDGFYSEVLLDLLAHPEAQESVDEALGRFLRSAARNTRTDLFSRATERLASIGSLATVTESSEEHGFAAADTR